MVGVIANFITPGDNEPSGFILTTLLGVIGALPEVVDNMTPEGRLPADCGTQLNF